MIAAGLGCRRGCGVRELIAAVERALAAAGQRRDDIRALYIPSFKRGEPALAEAAAELARPLVLLELELLRRQARYAFTQSAHTLARFGVPSIAETAALAGACTFPDAAAHTPRAHLFGPRQQSGSATCALARLDAVASRTEPST